MVITTSVACYCPIKVYRLQITTEPGCFKFEAEKIINSDKFRC